MSLADVASQAFYLAFLLAVPLVGAAALIGLIVSLFQAATQVQEHTLTTVPKIIAIGAVIAVAGSWMLGELVTFGTRLLGAIAHVG